MGAVRAGLAIGWRRIRVHRPTVAQPAQGNLQALFGSGQYVGIGAMDNGHWALDTGRWTLGAEQWALGAEQWTLGAGELPGTRQLSSTLETFPVMFQDSPTVPSAKRRRRYLEI